MNQEFSTIKDFNKTIELAGDNSISHRAVIFASMAKGKSVIKNISAAEDVNSTIKCFQQLGVEIVSANNELIVNGNGYKGLQEALVALDAGNSGTTARLLTGLLCAQDFSTVITGDSSLSKRPMKRVVQPLTEMGAIIETNDGKLPIRISASKNIKVLNYEMNVASAQVKSALILAALHNEQESTITEKEITRDHTEVMLGLKREYENGKCKIKVSLKDYPKAKEYFVPSDISSAAFLVVLTILSKNSELRIKNVSLNKTRTGYIDLLIKMGADITITDTKIAANEEYGDIIVKSGKLKNIEIPAEIIPNIIDEIPILSIAGLIADGTFLVRNASELRVKESDRIHSMCNNFRKIGIDVVEYEDGFELKSKNQENKSLIFESFDDHRIAMAFAVYSMISGNKGVINDFDCVKISNPVFLEQIKYLNC